MLSPKVLASGALRHRHHQCIVSRQVLAEALVELVGLDPQVAVAVRLKVRRRHRQVLLRQAAGALPGIGCEGSDVDQPHHVRRVTRLGDDRAAVGMPHQQYRPLHLRDHLARALSVIGQEVNGSSTALKSLIPLRDSSTITLPQWAAPQKPWTRTTVGLVLMGLPLRWVIEGLGCR
jgi:hypothetical protein